MDIGEAFFSSTSETAGSQETCDLTRWPNSGRGRRSPREQGAALRRRGGLSAFRRVSGFLLGLQNLPALVHAGFQVEVVGAAQLAGILVLGIGRLLQRVRRAAHATPRGRCFSTGNGHVGVL